MARVGAPECAAHPVVATAEEGLTQVEPPAARDLIEMTMDNYVNGAMP